jgi:Cof subfamily protein (haloacid dehalogenase superfamily)
VGFKLVMSDLDGTLLNSEALVTKEAISAVRRAEELGAIFAICSGRDQNSLAMYERLLGIDSPGHYSVGYNGGLVYECGGKILAESRIPKELGLELAKELKKLGLFPWVFAGSKIYAETEWTIDDDYTKSIKTPVSVVESFHEIQEDFSKIIARGERSDLVAKQEIMKKIIGARACISFSHPTILCISSRDAHKGRALEILAEHLGISKADTLAIGDNTNDVTMLKAAGLGVAVGNAFPEAMLAADVIMNETNDKNAVGVAIERFLAQEIDVAKPAKRFEGSNKMP